MDFFCIIKSWQLGLGQKDQETEREEETEGRQGDRAVRIFSGRQLMLDGLAERLPQHRLTPF